MNLDHILQMIWNYSYILVLGAFILAAVLVIKYLTKHSPKTIRIEDLHNKKGIQSARRSQKLPVTVTVSAIIIMLMLVAYIFMSVPDFMKIVF